MKFVFLSHLDANLYQFRLPIMRALVSVGHEVVALCPHGKFFDRFAAAGIRAEESFLRRKSGSPLWELRSFWDIYIRLRRLRRMCFFTIRPNLAGPWRTIGRGTAYFCAVTGLGSFMWSETSARRYVGFLNCAASGFSGI